MKKIRFDLTKKRTWKKILSVGLAALSCAAAVFGVVALTKTLKDETRKVHVSYSFGVIDEVTGKPDTDLKTSIYTKDAFDAKGLSIELDFESTVTYQVFWYNSVGELLFCSEELSKGAEFYAPAGCKARIEVTPELEEDQEELSWVDMMKYAGEVEIRVDKSQKLETEDFTEISLSHSMFTAHEGSVTFNSTGAATYENDENTTYTYVNNGTYSAVYVKKFVLDSENTGLHVRLLDGTVVSYYASDLAYEYDNGAMKLPVKADDAIILPKGATLYIFGAFGAAENVTDTILCFY